MDMATLNAMIKIFENVLTHMMSYEFIKRMDMSCRFSKIPYFYKELKIPCKYFPTMPKQT